MKALLLDLHGGLYEEGAALPGAREGFTYASLNEVFRLAQAGLPLIGIGRNRCFRERGEWMLDAGAFLTAIAWATDTKALVMGTRPPPSSRNWWAPRALPACDSLMVAAIWSPTWPEPLPAGSPAPWCAWARSRNETLGACRRALS